MTSILICGGAGYIGSHVLAPLAQRGIDAVVFDNLSTGHRQAVADAWLVEGDIRDATALDAVFSSRRFDAVMHFCALSLVGDSARLPLAYYQNNVAGTLTLLEAMQRHAVDKLVFSSTAAVYGHPQQALIAEEHPMLPINPYGRSKLMIEQVLDDAAAAYGLRAVALRYFNAAGAHPDGYIGESHDPETHLIPNVLKAVLGDGAGLKVFGSDYPTADGTCVRDYIHVDDLAAAHIAALEWMHSNKGFRAFNLGNGQGFSVMQIIDAARRVTGKDVPFEVAARRPGDPASLVACADLARDVLGWQPRYQEIESIIETAWKWHSARRY